MRDDARRAADLLPGVSAGRGLACFLGAVAARMLGDHAEAVCLLDVGVRNTAVLAPQLHALCLAERTAIALVDGDWDAVCEHGLRARAQLDRHGLAGVPSAALALAAAASARAHRGRIEEAHRDLQAAAGLLAALPAPPAWFAAETHLLLGRVALQLSEVTVARGQLEHATRHLRELRDAVDAERRVTVLGELIDAFAPPGGARRAQITPAELRVLRFLPTHLSFREIAERTDVSANTVKTQANAVYRKFGVASRSEAVAHARSCGLLEA
jgi:LuxR family maltose regulon positive regulatory protein